MASTLSSGGPQIPPRTERLYVFVFDRRHGAGKDLTIDVTDIARFGDFLRRLRQAFGVGAEEKFVITSTNRTQINDSNWGEVDCGDSLYILKSQYQLLSAPAQERVNFLPHYDTIVKGGMYEYYASEGQNPLPYAFAELIDNSLAATAHNFGPRNIDIVLYFDEFTPTRNCIYVTDNGKGMSSKQLNNWAIYRLSKFIRRDQRTKFGEDGDDHGLLSDISANAPRSLNSDISYFGVGGKQAVFFIGNSVRMISKPHESRDVHELYLAKEEFEKREKNREDIYSSFIRNRKPGDSTHIFAEEEMLKKVISEEQGKDNFTTVVIHGINPDHVQYLKLHMKEWTRQLAHIYHYYIHGPAGNVEAPNVAQRPASPFKNIDITVHLQLRGQQNPRVVNLRDIQDDMQTQYIRTAGSTFEFKAVCEGTGVVEGILHYHPFLYDKETYPSDANDARVVDLEQDDYTELTDIRPARGKRPIFECYWNGRLIPYTSVEEFDWCCSPKKRGQLPLECYNRVSGVLWTNDKFQVSTNKLTFLDLEMKLRDKNTTWCRVIGKNEKRTAIDKEFIMWLKECHEKCDKQVKFSSFRGTITRPEMPRNRQGPWAIYEQIEWDGKVYKKGQLVRINRVVPIFYGSIKRILLFGDHEGDVFATGGDLEVVQEPHSLYDEVRIVPLRKLDRTASQILVKKFIEEEEARLPEKILITWPNGDDVSQNERRPAGKAVGDMKIEIANRKGELISKLPGSSQKKLLVELKVIWHSPNGDEEIVSHISQHGKNWPYWFRKMENIKNLGGHTLQLQVTLNETGAYTFAGKKLPCQKIRFMVTEAAPEKFTVGMMDGPFRVGVPFQIPLDFQDEFSNPTKPTSKLKPTLEASGVDLKYEGLQIKGNSLVIRGITATCPLPNSSGKSFTLTVKVPGLEEESQTLKIRLLPGMPHKLQVDPDDDTEIENGCPVSYRVSVLDEAGNVTTTPRLQVLCKFFGAPGLPVYHLDCSSSGQGTLTGDPLQLKKIDKDFTVTARIEIPGQKVVPMVERKVFVCPSTRPSALELSYLNEEGEQVPLKPGQDLSDVAGSVIKGLRCTMKDEAGREKDWDERTAAKIKVNWTPKLSVQNVVKGELPDIKVPNLVTENKYCVVSLSDVAGLEFSFTVKAVAGPPAEIKCRINGKSTVRIGGEKMAGDIMVGVRDQNGNEIKKLNREMLKDLGVVGDGLIIQNTERALAQVSGFLISGISFEQGSLGIRTLCVMWQDLKDYVRVEVTAGPPAKITLPGWDLSQPVSVYSDSRLPHPITVQLCDEAGNPSAETGVKVQLAKDTGIRLIPGPQPTKSDDNGEVQFGMMSVSGKRGVYQIQPKAFYGRLIISGPKLKINIQPDPSKPTGINIDYDKTGSLVVGEPLPDFTVEILGEDDNILTEAKPSCLMMHLWQMEKSQAKATKYGPDSKQRSKKTGSFMFSKKRAPDVAGSYFILFSYIDGQYEVQSNQVMINIKPGPPKQLHPVTLPGTPTVSNTRNVSSRLLIRNLKLELRDKYGNVSGNDATGTVSVEIIHDTMKTELPQLVGNTRRLELPLVNGAVTLQNLSIQENSAGKDGQEYTLQCQIQSDDLKEKIPPYSIPFLFYNDVKKQSQMAALSRERDSLMNAIKTYRSLFDTTQQLVKELQISISEAKDEEMKGKAELRKQGLPVGQLSTVSSVDGLVQSRSREKEQVLNAPRRMCGLAPAPKETGVLGKIAHLAQVSDNDIARVLSWHMSADMDCVVTTTTKKAKEIYQRTNGKQQVLPLDSIYRKNLPDWNKPLPHNRIRSTWKPPGSPVYARSLLVFPHDENSCRVVFSMLLGDTLILNTLDDANNYRQQIVQHTHCPTILTRTGDRIRSNGKFGGLMNVALPIEKLRGAVFGQPLPDTYHNITTQIESLQSFRSVILKRQNAEKELAEQVARQKTPEMIQKVNECEEAEQQLTDIEKRLGVTSPVSDRQTPSSRKQSAVTNSTPVPSKRGRASLNGTATVTPSPSTPTRQSLRRLAQQETPGEDEPRKRSRRY